jgi:hypothetical protein
VIFYQFDTGGDLNDDRLCFLGDTVKGMESEDYRFFKGKAVKPVYPSDPRIFLRKKYPGVKLASHVGNMLGMIVASSALRQLIEKHCADVEIEYLPFTLIDHKKRPYSTDYCIVNPLGGLDCVDLKASKITYNSTGKVSFIDELVLDQRKVARAPQLFRVDLRPSMYILGQALADEIRAAKLTNILLTEIRVSGG